MNRDSGDRKILYELDKNARQSLKQIGRTVRLSPEVVFHRIRNLEKEGIIEYYYTTIDPSKFGYKAFRVYVKAQDLTLEKEKEIFDWLVQNKKTWWVLRVEGKWDIDFFLWVKDDYEFEQEWLKFSQRFRKYIDEKLIQIYTHLHHFHRPYLIGKKNDEEKEEVIFSNQREQVDTIDLQILSLLSTNARMKITEMSKKIPLTPKNIAQRIKGLQKKNIILSFRVKINLEKIGYRYYKIEVDLNNYARLRQLYQFAKLHPNITYINQVIGLADFDADIEVPSEEEFDKVITQIKKEFGEDIRDIRYLTIRKVYKISYIPEFEFHIPVGLIKSSS